MAVFYSIADSNFVVLHMKYDFYLWRCFMFTNDRNKFDRFGV